MIPPRGSVYQNRGAHRTRSTSRLARFVPELPPLVANALKYHEEGELVVGEEPEVIGGEPEAQQ